MNPSSSIKKGKELENHVADRLAVLGIDVRAGRQIGSGNGKRKGDISTDIGWTIECKNTKALRWSEARKQVAREAMGYGKEMVVWHETGTPMGQSVAVINLEDMFDLLKFWKDHQGREGILDKYTIKRNLERATFHLKEVIKEL